MDTTASDRPPLRSIFSQPARELLGDHLDASRFRLCFESSPTGLGLVGRDGHLEYVNAAFLRQFGVCSEVEILGRTLVELVHGGEAESELPLLKELIDGKRESYEVERWLPRPDGGEGRVCITVSLGRDQRGRPIQYLLQLQDASDGDRRGAGLQALGDRDPLTGLPNRRRFVQELARQLGHVRRYGGPSTFVMLELGGLDVCERAFGHGAADELICLVASSIRRRVRSPDLPARIGPDQLAVLLPATGQQFADRLARELIDLVARQSLYFCGQDLHLTATASVTALQSTRRELDEEDLVAGAELAIQRGRRESDRRHQPVASATPRRSARFTWLERIRRALDEERFVLQYQPIVSLDSGEVAAHEALVRLDDEPGGELVPPTRFLAAAERYGMIAEIDRVVIRQVLALLADRRAPAELRIAVNVSARSTTEPGMLGFIDTSLRRHAISPARLIFEITETAAISNIDQAKAFCQGVERLGCAVALDDFGAGFGSFYYVKHLPFRYLKIDGDFIRGLTSSPHDRLMVKALVDVARGMGKQTIAEYVGDEATANLLRNFGVDYAQGFQLGQPCSPGMAFELEIPEAPSRALPAARP